MEENTLTDSQLIPFIGAIDVRIGKIIGKLSGYDSGYFLVEISDWEGMNVSVKNITPICRPFSQLTEEIEIDGERFVPVTRIFGDVQFEEWDTSGKHIWGTFIIPSELKPVGDGSFCSARSYSFEISEEFNIYIEQGCPVHVFDVIRKMIELGFSAGLPAGTWKEMEEKQ